MPHFLNKISALPSQFLKWQPKILLVGQHRRTEKLLPRIKWHNYEKADSHTEAVSRVYDSFLTPNPVDIILLEQEDLFAAKDNLLDFIQKDHHFKNVPVILFISDRQEIQNVELNKKYPLLKYEIIKNKVSKKKLIIALSNSLLAENIQSYRQEKLDRNILINDLFKDHRREKKDWSFKPVFQKLVDLSTGEVVGYEMLMRWEHKGKMIPPSRFIPLSEKTGLIRYIDQRGLEFAALRCEHLYQQKKFLTVNLSPLNLNSKEYFYFLKRITERTPNFSDVVHLEITETAVVNNVKSFLKLSKLNPNLIMDDFGSGFAHFALFYRLASKGIIKKIKIDKAFFQEMIKDHLRGIGFLKRLIGAFNSLGVDVLVEGVETLMQYETLRGIDLPIQIQGYYLGRPEAIGI